METLVSGSTSVLPTAGGASPNPEVSGVASTSWVCDLVVWA